MANSFGISNGTQKVVGLVIGAIIAAQILPVAFDMFFGVDTGSWGGMSADIWLLIPILAMISILLLVVREAT